MNLKNFDVELAAHFIDESNRIEDIVLTRKEIEDALRAGSSAGGESALGGKKGHPAALLSLEFQIQEKRNLTELMLKHCQRLIIEEQNTLLPKEHRLGAKLRGNYRPYQIQVGSHVGEVPEKIRESMKGLVARISTFQREYRSNSQEKTPEHIRQTILSIADFHFDFEEIHPFADGNGRTGRALVWYLYRACGLTPFIFTSNDKGHTYYEAFRSKEKMREYFLARSKLSCPP